jgi:hypothetical protein
LLKRLEGGVRGSTRVDGGLVLGVIEEEGGREV